MLKFLVAALAAFSLLASAARADDAADTRDLAAAMETLNAAFTAEDEAAIRAMMTPDHTAVARMYDGAATIDQQFALFPDVEYSTYDETAAEISLLTDTVAIVNYRISLKGTFRGEPLPSRLYVTQVWVKQDGKWLQRAYQETAIGD